MDPNDNRAGLAPVDTNPSPGWVDNVNKEFLAGRGQAMMSAIEQQRMGAASGLQQFPQVPTVKS